MKFLNLHGFERAREMSFYSHVYLIQRFLDYPHWRCAMEEDRYWKSLPRWWY